MLLGLILTVRKESLSYSIQSRSSSFPTLPSGTISAPRKVFVHQGISEGHCSPQGNKKVCGDSHRRIIRLMSEIMSKEEINIGS